MHFFSKHDNIMHHLIVSFFRFYKVLNFVQNFLSNFSQLISKQEFMVAQIDITNSCNLRCKHCYHQHHDNKQAISIDEWTEVLNQYKALLEKLYLRPHVIISGGEPLASEKFVPILNLIKSLFDNPLITVLTNGTLLSKNYIELLKDLNVHFQISLDGATDKDHDNIRGKGVFSKVSDTIKNLQKAELEVTTLTTLSAATSPNIEKFFKLGKKMNLSSVNFTRFISQGSGKNRVDTKEDRPLTPQELCMAYKEIIACSKKYRVRTNTSKPLYHLIDKNLGGHGKFGTQGIIVDYKGNLKVSSRSDFILGNILEKGLEKLFFHHPIMKQLRKGNVDTCGKCSHGSQCGGDRNASYAETGSFCNKDPGCWITNN